MPVVWTSLIAEADLPDIDETCFPSREVVDELVEGYLSTIAEPRRARALIDLATYDQAAAVLTKTKPEPAVDKSFRFWCQKAFVLAPVASALDDAASNDVALKTRSTDKWVACREDFYEILVTAHHAADHDEREATFDILAQTWNRLPKAICQGFIRKCPTCNPSQALRPGSAATSRPHQNVSSLPDHTPTTSSADPSPLLGAEASPGDGLDSDAPKSPSDHSECEASLSPSASPRAEASTSPIAAQRPRLAISAGPPFVLYAWSKERVDSRLRALGRPPMDWSTVPKSKIQGVLRPRTRPQPAKRPPLRTLRGHSLPAFQRDWNRVEHRPRRHSQG